MRSTPPHPLAERSTHSGPAWGLPHPTPSPSARPTLVLRPLALILGLPAPQSDVRRAKVKCGQNAAVLMALRETPDESTAALTPMRRLLALEKLGVLA